MCGETSKAFDDAPPGIQLYTYSLMPHTHSSLNFRNRRVHETNGDSYQ
jgi:hypothetical protein